MGFGLGLDVYPNPVPWLPWLFNSNTLSHYLHISLKSSRCYKVAKSVCI